MKSDDKSIDKPVKAVAIKAAQQAHELDIPTPPKIVAKGEGAVAERILDIAFAEGVKVRQDKDLTELLDAFDVDSPVPLEALHAVSLVLERVYSENQKLAGAKEEDQGEDLSKATQRAADATVDGETGELVVTDKTVDNSKRKGST